MPRQLIFIASLIFFVLVNQNIIKTLKNSLVVSLIEPEIIVFIKLYLEVPISFIVLLIYIKLYNTKSARFIFNTTLLIFSILFFLFAYVLFPNLGNFSIDKDNVNNIVGKFIYLKWLMKLLQNWILVLFYIIGELWTTILYSLLIWEAINRTVTHNDSKKYYPKLNFLGQLSISISGIMLFYLFPQNKIQNQIPETLEMIKTIQFLMTLVIIICFLIFLIYKHLDNNHFLERNKTEILFLQARKTSILENLRFITSSNYILALSINVMCYSFVIMIIEGLWFAMMHELYSNAQDFIRYQSIILIYVGISTIFFSIISNYITSRVKWLNIALVTPYILTLLGGLFILLCYAEHSSKLNFISSNKLFIIVSAGSIANILGKGAKYSFFDITKEIFFIPLDSAIKAKAKAVVDIFCFSFGKILGISCSYFIFSIYPEMTYADITAYLLLIFTIISIIWIITIKKILIMHPAMVNIANIS